MSDDVETIIGYIESLFFYEQITVSENDSVASYNIIVSDDDLYSKCCDLHSRRRKCEFGVLSDPPKSRNRSKLKLVSVAEYNIL